MAQRARAGVCSVYRYLFGTFAVKASASMGRGSLMMSDNDDDGGLPDMRYCEITS